MLHLHPVGTKGAEQKEAGFLWKVMLCCISVNNSDIEKKHGINLKL